MASLADPLPPAQLSHWTEFRRDLHTHPELGYEETRTAQRVTEELTRLGIPYVPGIGETGVVAYLAATRPTESTIALRADMDALPIHELTNLPYASQTPGRMHACGHDGHTTILLGAAEALLASERPHNVILMFQPAEEGGGGARKLVAAGALDGRLIGKPVQRVYGLHGNPQVALGSVSTRPGPLMASAASFRITVRGKGAHAAAPHTGIDPIVIASHIVLALQTVASRNVDPLDSVVVTVGKFQSGVAHNVIPETAVLDGTLRTLDGNVEARARERLKQLVTQTARAHGGEATLEWVMVPYPVVVNDANETERFFRIARNVLGSESVHWEERPVMGGEDFSFYGQAAPACFFWLGLQDPTKPALPNLHSPYFDFNDDAIPTGVAQFLALATEPI